MIGRFPAHFCVWFPAVSSQPAQCLECIEPQLQYLHVRVFEANIPGELKEGASSFFKSFMGGLDAAIAKAKKVKPALLPNAPGGGRPLDVRVAP